jgi:hypothetical protein
MATLERNTFTQSHQGSRSVSLQPVHWALMGYYAHQKHQTRSEMLRELITAVFDFDEGFDPKDFRRYVNEVAAPEETNPKARDVLASQVDELLDRRAKKNG